MPNLLFCSRLRVVVDHEHLVDQARGEEALDHISDRVALGIGHKHHRHSLTVPHDLFPDLS